MVVVEPDLAVKRLGERNNMDEGAARARLASQLTNAERVAHADVVVENNGTLDELEGRIAEAWDALQERIQNGAGENQVS